MAQITDLKVITFNAEDQDTITPESTFEDLMEAMENEDGVIYDLGRYFEDQNNDDIGSHWSFLVNMTTREILNSKYNDEI